MELKIINDSISKSYVVLFQVLIDLIISCLMVFSLSTVHQHRSKPFGRPEDILLSPIAGCTVNGPQRFS